MRHLRITAFTAMGFLLFTAPAWGEFRGSDLMDNIGPGEAFDGMADKYPLSHYALDYHVDAGVTDSGGIPALITQWAAAQLWAVLVFALRMIIDTFAWAFSLDLIGGAHGALGPVARSVRSSYESLGGSEWLMAAVVIAGLWALWRGLVQRRYTATVGGLAVSMAIMMLALFCIYQPERSIGRASQWTNDLSGAFLAAGSGRSPDSPTEAKRDVVQHLRSTLIYKPWVVLNFGGLRHCVNTRDPDPDEFPKPVPCETTGGRRNPDADVTRDHIERDRNGYGGYAPRFLAQAPGSDARDKEYEALRDGKIPDDPAVEYIEPRVVDPNAPAAPSQFAGYKVDKADAPAVDVQQEGGAYQRFTVVLLIAAGAFGIIALLALLSVIVILAQVAALALLAFAPVALIIGVIPGRGHDLFKWWGMTLLTALFIKVLYSLVLGILILISVTLTAATATMGFLFAFGLQAAFFWMILIYRKRITQRLLGATLRSERGHGRYITKAQRKMEHAVERPFSALAGRAMATTAGAAATAAGMYKQASASEGSGDMSKSDPKGGPTGAAGKDGKDGYRYDMAEQGTSGSREWQEGEPQKLDGRDPRFRVRTPEELQAQRAQQAEQGNGRRELQPEQTGLVTGALDPPEPKLDRERARTDLSELNDPPEPRRIEAAVHGGRMAQLGELMADQLEPPARRERPEQRP